MLQAENKEPQEDATVRGVKPFVLVGIPAFNEEQSIGPIVLEAQRYADMVVVCDDGSSDLTASVARGHGACVIKHKRNLGKGAAIRSLFKKALDLDADVIVTLDGDGQHDPSEIPCLLRPIKDLDADIVVGSRFISRKNGMPRYRSFGSKIINLIVNLHANGHFVLDTQSGFRAYNRKALGDIEVKTEGMGVDSEILLKAYANEVRVQEIAISCRYRPPTAR